MKKFLSAIIGAVLLASCSNSNSNNNSTEDHSDFKEPTVFKNDDVEIRQIDEHTWHGNGNRVFNESIYLVEGDSLALLIDAGTVMPGLRKIVEDIVKKPVILAATHVHGDHTGMAINDWEQMWLCEADTVNIPSTMPDYNGEKLYLQDGQTFNLGGRTIEVVFTPGHTPGSVTFVDKAAHYGFSGDAFGSGNLLVFSTLSNVIASGHKMAEYMEANGIEKMYPGHYWGYNLETLQRVKDVAELSEGILAGKYEPEASNNKSLPYVVNQRGVKINYGEGNKR